MQFRGRPRLRASRAPYHHEEPAIESKRSLVLLLARNSELRNSITFKPRIELQRAQLAFFDFPLIWSDGVWSDGDAFVIVTCAYVSQLACCWSSGFHGPAAIMPADFQNSAVLSFAASSYISNLDVEQGQDSRDLSVGVRMEITIRSCGEVVLACRFLHGETASKGRRANQHHGHARQDAWTVRQCTRGA